MRAAHAWLAVLAGCGSGAPPEPPASAARPPLPAGRHWGHQTLADMLAPDAIFEGEHRILGRGYPTVLAEIGGTEPDTDCNTSTTRSSCRETTRDALYIPGFTDDHPLEVRVDPRLGPGRTIAAYTVTVPGREIAPDVVLAAVRAKLGAPNRLAGSLEWSWIRSDRSITVHARSSDDTSVDVEVRAEAAAAGPPPAMTDATTVPSCKRAIAAFDAYESCAKIPLRERDLHADLSDLVGAWPAAACEQRTAELAARVAQAGCGS